MSVERIRARNEHVWLNDVVTHAEVEALCDLADAARELRALHWERADGCDACRQVWPCETRRYLDPVLVRLDGEDTG